MGLAASTSLSEEVNRRMEGIHVEFTSIRRTTSGRNVVFLGEHHYNEENMKHLHEALRTLREECPGDITVLLEEDIRSAASERGPEEVERELQSLEPAAALDGATLEATIRRDCARVTPRFVDVRPKGFADMMLAVSPYVSAMPEEGQYNFEQSMNRLYDAIMYYVQDRLELEYLRGAVEYGEDAMEEFRRVAASLKDRAFGVLEEEPRAMDSDPAPPLWVGNMFVGTATWMDVYTACRIVHPAAGDLVVMYTGAQHCRNVERILDEYEMLEVARDE